jgi:MFS family permease
MAIYAFLVFGSNFLAPFLSGFINDSMGWRAVIWFGTIVLACTTIIIFFIMEETMYFRNDLEGVTADGRDSDGALKNQSASNEKVKGSADATVDDSSSPAHSVQQGANFLPERTYLQKLNLFVKFPNRPSKKEHLTMMYRPLLMFFQFPNVTWAGFLYGSNLSWYNVLNATASSILGSAPYNFPARMVGTAYLSPFVGAFLSVIWSGWFGDKVALFMARRNGGVREPEHRLWTLTVSGLFVTAGLILWGVGASQQIHYMGLIFGLGMLTFGVVSGSSTAISYDVDCFKDIAGESMITVIIVRNTFGFAFSYAITPWISNQGLLKTFVAVGMVSLACTGSFLLMVGFGKQLRKWSAPKYWQYAATTLSTH